DSQDLPRDIREGVTTFVRFKKSFLEIEKELACRKEELFKSFCQTGLPPERINDFLFVFECFYWGILYKVRFYKRICSDDLDPRKIRSFPQSRFRIPPDSLRFFWFCLPRAMRFNLLTI
ncbi:MAG: hypothetical protein Q8867_11120, partial [Bacteroidota bacterium]|nr:hypothetical protein [Bacteroidota bacterium]